MRGTAAGGFAGDNGPAVEAKLNHPDAAAVDTRGNLYISDYINNRVRKVNTHGTITTIAGTGKPADYTNYDQTGPATRAPISVPQGIAVDRRGNIYVARDSTRVRRITAAGQISTIAGAGFGYGGDHGPALKALFHDPEGIAVDANGDVYVSDYGNNRVRKIRPDGMITTVAGTGKPGFSGDGGPAQKAQLNLPNGLAVDRTGNLYIADFRNYRVREVTPDGKIRTIAGNGATGRPFGPTDILGDGGPALNAQVNPDYGLAVDGKGNLYVGDSLLLRKISPKDIISTLAGTERYRHCCGPSFSGDGGPATGAEGINPWGIAVDQHGVVYFADNGYWKNRIRRVA